MPSYLWLEVFQFASIGRWQPPQDVVQLRWQVKQAISSGLCARSSSKTPGPKVNWPVSAPAFDISLARADFLLQLGCSRSTLSLTRLPSHSRVGSMIDRWIRARNGVLAGKGE